MAEAKATISGAKKKLPTSSTKAVPHPSTAEMVGAAIEALKARKGSSAQAIRLYIARTYTIDPARINHHIRKYLTTAPETGKLLLVSGKGASGYYKLPPQQSEKKKKKVATSTTSNAKSPAKAKVPKTKKPAKPKVTTAKSPKIKKTTKPPTQKPKAPKPKKAAVSKSPKKTAAKKK